MPPGFGPQYMPLAYSPQFIQNVIGPYLVTLLGAVLALVAGVWWMLAGEFSHGEPRPRAFRALSTVAFALWIIGLFWQVAGYLHLEYSRQVW